MNSYGALNRRPLEVGWRDYISAKVGAEGYRDLVDWTSFGDRSWQNSVRDGHPGWVRVLEAEFQAWGFCNTVSVMEQHISEVARPVLRGYLHVASAVVAPFALVFLVLLADTPRGIIGAAVFGASLVALYWTSASYHVLVSRRRRSLMRRLDRSVIYIFIAGAYTPFALKLMSNAWGIPILSVVGGLAIVGFVTTLAAPAAPRWVRVGLYLVIGWVGVVGITELVRSLPGEALALLVLGGLLYSVGGATYAARRPDPFPRVFGFHETFHTLQVAATAVLYYLVAVYVVQS